MCMRMRMTTVFMRIKRRVRTMRMCLLRVCLLRVCLLRMQRMLFVGMASIRCLPIRREHIDLGPGQSAAAHLARLQPRANIERGGGFL